MDDPSQLFVWRGRISRRAFAPLALYYAAAIPAFAAGAALLGAGAAAGMPGSPTKALAAGAIAFIAAAASIALLGPLTRRLHDQSKSALSIIVRLAIPSALSAAILIVGEPTLAPAAAALGVAMIVTLSLPAAAAFSRGVSGSNRFGADPLAAPGADHAAGAIAARGLSVRGLAFVFFSGAAIAVAATLFVTGAFKGRSAFEVTEPAAAEAQRGRPDGDARLMLESMTAREFLDECDTSTDPRSLCYRLYDAFLGVSQAAQADAYGAHCYAQILSSESRGSRGANKARSRDLSLATAWLAARPGYWGYDLRIALTFASFELHPCSNSNAAAPVEPASDDALDAAAPADAPADGASY